MGSYRTMDILRLSTGFRVSAGCEPKLHSGRLYFLLPKGLQTQDGSLSSGLELHSFSCLSPPHSSYNSECSQATPQTPAKLWAHFLEMSHGKLR